MENHKLIQCVYIGIYVEIGDFHDHNKKTYQAWQ